MSDPIEFDLLVEFCQKALSDGKINHHQYNYLVCGWSEGKSEEFLSEMNLKNAFEAYQRELERNKIDHEYQAGVVQDLINDVNVNLKQAQAKLEPLQNEHDLKQEEYDAKKVFFDNWDRRFKMFPENQRFQKEFEKVQGEMNGIQSEMDEIQGKMLKIQQEIENFEQQIRLWNTELIELKR